MAELVITELRRTGSGVDPTPTSFRWTSDTHTSIVGGLATPLKINTMRRMPAGAEKPVEQVMSVEWPPFKVEGEWNDKWAGRGFAQSTKIAFARMCGRTPLVRLQIDQESWVGIITEFTPTYVTRDRQGYSFTISPHENELVGSFQQSANQVPPQPINQRVEVAVDTLDDLVTAADLGQDVPTRRLDIEDSKAQLGKVSDAVDQAVGAALADSTDDPNRDLFVLAGAFRSVEKAASDMMFAVADKRSDTVVAIRDAITILKFDEWRTGVFRASVLTLGTSRDAEIDILAKATRKTRAIHRAKAGESLERISLRYYGTADNWRAIFDANGLDSLILEGGEVLIIPERTA